MYLKQCVDAYAAVVAMTEKEWESCRAFPYLSRIR